MRRSGHEQLEARLPVRFPTWLADEDTLSNEVQPREAQLRASLDGVRGQCELAITALWSTPGEPTLLQPTQPTRSGTQYLLDRLQALAGSDERRERARALADEIERVAGADLKAVRREVCPSARVALSSALLAPRVTESELMGRLPRTQDGVRILVNGPWPTYTFATATILRQPQHTDARGTRES